MAVIGPFRKKYYCFTSYARSAIIMSIPPGDAQLRFPTLEHVLQAAKYNTDVARQSFLLDVGDDPMVAHRRGIPIVPHLTYYENLPNLLLQANRIKAQYNPSFRQTLANTHQDYLIHYNYWHDKYLGVCACPTCMHQGLNLLGMTLMVLRTEILPSNNTSTGLLPQEVWF